MTKETTRPILPVEEGTGPLSTSAPAVPRRTDYAWAVVFKINIAIAILSVKPVFIFPVSLASSLSATAVFLALNCHLHVRADISGTARSAPFPASVRTNRKLNQRTMRMFF